MDLSKNKDRGTIKWTALMLPEQVQKLHKWAAEADYIPEPNHNEYEFEELAHQIQTAVQTNSLLQLHYWQDGKTIAIEGTIKELPMNTPYLTILSPQGNKRVYIPHILNIHVYDG